MRQGDSEPMPRERPSQVTQTGCVIGHRPDHVHRRSAPPMALAGEWNRTGDQLSVAFR
jgi:hypothetical protein